jgi:putative SOS response-associated peptidase YedK
MCYSAMVEQRFKAWLRWKGARIETGLFEQLFRRRVEDDSVKIAKALEANFAAPRTPQEKRVKKHIDDFHARKTAEWEAEVFRQRRRLADAERALKTRQTRKALEDQRIAGRKIESNLKRIADLKRGEPVPDDFRIFPFWYAPVMVREGGDYVVKPMRYHCRLHGKPATTDTRYPGLYNARRDSLERYWKPVFGRQHAIVMISSFFENVARHEYEKRALQAGERETNLVLQFDPRPPTTMLLACLWDRWQAKGSEDELYSFAVITDEPLPEVAATGHNRCPIPLKAENVDAWLAPGSTDLAALYRLLDDRQPVHYEHRLAA